MRQIDSDFLALPLRQLADAALQRARDLGAEHADFRLERVRAETLRLCDARLEGSMDADDLGYAVRVVKDGTWGFAAGIELTPEAAAQVAEQAVRGGRGQPRPSTASPSSWPPSRSTPTSPGSPPTRSTRSTCRCATRWRCSPTGRAGLLRDPRVDHVEASLMQVKEQKFYADTAGTVTTQQRVRLHPELTAMKVRRRPLRDDAHARPAGRPGVRVPHRHRLGLPAASSPASPS